MASIEGKATVKARRTWLFKPVYAVVKALCWLGIVHPARGASFVTKHCLTMEYDPQSLRVCPRRSEE